MQYRRARIEGGTYFFTVVTHKRKKILCESENVSLLRTIFREVMAKHPFKIDAFVLLPEHLHCIWINTTSTPATVNTQVTPIRPRLLVIRTNKNQSL